MVPPIMESVTASTRNCIRMSRPRAPTAMRSPISRVRSVTDTSMMFMMPMPPTRSDTRSEKHTSELQSPVHIVCRLLLEKQKNLHVLDIVVGVDAVNLGAFKTPFRARGAGIKAEEWMPLDLLRSEGSAGMDLFL